MKWFRWLMGRRESPEEARHRREQQRKAREFNEALKRYSADEVIGEPDWEWFLRTEHAIVHTPYGFRDISGAVSGKVRMGWCGDPGTPISPSADGKDVEEAFKDAEEAFDIQAREASLGPIRSWSCPYCAGWAPLR